MRGLLRKKVLGSRGRSPYPQARTVRWGETPSSRPGAHAEHERGAAMLLAIILMAITGLMSAGIWQAMHRETSEHYRAERLAAAHHLAEAGLEHALHALSRGLAAPEGEYALGKGHYSVVAAPSAPGVYRLESQGLLRDGTLLRARVVLHAEARTQPGGGIASYTLLPGGTP